MHSSQERRKTNRFTVAIPVKLTTAAGDLLTESRNISTDGILVRSPAPLSIGLRVQMSFSVPGQNSSHEDVRFNSGGTVARLEPTEGGFGIAITWYGASVCTVG
jgi:hypothetical protein